MFPESGLTTAALSRGSCRLICFYAGLTFMEEQLTHAEELLKRLNKKGGEPLTADERRICIEYFDSDPAQRDKTNVELAKLFGVNEATIRRDKEAIRKRDADEMSKDDIGNVIAELRKKYERYCIELARSKKKAQEGTAVWLQYHNCELKLMLEVIEALQSLGYYPKNLGPMTQNKFVFIAHVARDGAVTTLPVDESKKALPVPKQKLLASRSDENLEERAKVIQELEAEFTDNPAPTPTKVEDGEESY